MRAEPASRTYASTTTLRTPSVQKVASCQLRFPRARSPKAFANSCLARMNRGSVGAVIGASAQRPQGLGEAQTLVPCQLPGDVVRYPRHEERECDGAPGHL